MCRFAPIQDADKNATPTLALILIATVALWAARILGGM